ncbi:unnamed protein product [Allacma fusca]|uniref:Uncharacterized protein n=1 Tax=Allacma fusca TaxID=39272 RepID=A0A8J2LJN6_9HEXA|nr:unnamed protein product [Allacma fusca]
MTLANGNLALLAGAKFVVGTVPEQAGNPEDVGLLAHDHQRLHTLHFGICAARQVWAIELLVVGEKAVSVFEVVENPVSASLIWT